MKRTAVLLSMGLLSFGLVRAQSSLVSQIAGDKAATEKLYFSLKLGLSCGTLKGMEDAERLGGPNIGLFATIRLSDKLSLAVEVDPLSRKGVTGIPFVPTGDPAIDPYFLEPASSALVLGYIDAPVLLKYRLSGRLNLGAGPFVGFRISAEERFRATVLEAKDLAYRRDVESEYAALDYGLVFEASWVMAKPRRGEGLVFHIRYQAGMADVSARPGSGPARTSVVQVFLSFPFIHTD